MTGLVAGIGIRAAVSALAGKAASNAVSDVKGVGKWLGSLDLAHFLLLVLALFGAWQTVGRWAQHRHTAKVEGQLSEATAALKSARASLATSQANEKNLRVSLAGQNAAVSNLAATSAQQQQAAAIARKQAAQRVAEAQASSDALKRSAAQKPAPGAPCGPSDILKRQWK